MKKVLALLLVLGLASAASATVIDVVALDIGLSEGRLGLSELDPLQESDTIGLAIVLNHNPYPDYPSYDGYLLSSMDLDLHISGPASLDAGTYNKLGDPVWQYDPGLSPFVVNDNDYHNELGNGLDQIMGVALTPIAGPTDLVWDLLLHCDGDVGSVVIDLTLNGLTQYSEYKTPGGAPYPGPWIDAVEGDLGDLVIYQIPEPITIALLGIGGLFLRRRK